MLVSEKAVFQSDKFPIVKIIVTLLPRLKESISAVVDLDDLKQRRQVKIVIWWWRLYKTEFSHLIRLEIAGSLTAQSLYAIDISQFTRF